MFGTAVEGGAIKGVQWVIFPDPLNQIWVRNEEPTEGDRVCVASLDGQGRAVRCIGGPQRSRVPQIQTETRQHYLWHFRAVHRSTPFQIHELRSGAGSDPPRKTEPQEAGNFGLRGSIRAGFTGRFAVNVTQLKVSSKRLEDRLLFRENPAAPVRRESGKRAAFSKAA
jgi:hypothetical protein